MDLAEYLPFFSKLSPKQQQTLVDSVEPMEAKAGTIVHNGHLDCLGLLIIRSGQLRVYTLSSEGREVTLYRLFDHDICLFSASCVMPDIQFEVIIEAEKDTKMWVIPSCLFKELMESSVAVANYANQLISSRFSEVMWLMEQIMWKSFDKRLAASGGFSAGREHSGKLPASQNDPRAHCRPPGNRPGGGYEDAEVLSERGHGAPEPGRNRHHRRKGPAKIS